MILVRYVLSIDFYLHGLSQSLVCLSFQYNVMILSLVFSFISLSDFYCFFVSIYATIRIFFLYKFSLEFSLFDGKA